MFFSWFPFVSSDLDWPPISTLTTGKPKRLKKIKKFYFDIENLALWTRSGIDGYAEEITSGVMESWSSRLRHSSWLRRLNWSIGKNWASIVAKKLVLLINSILRQVSFHYSISAVVATATMAKSATPLLQYALLGPIKQSPFRQSRALRTRIFTRDIGLNTWNIEKRPRAFVVCSNKRRSSWWAGWMSNCHSMYLG